jgi:hypothetical protein
MWMGGNVPLGYDVRERKLVVNEAEASAVRILHPMACARPDSCAQRRSPEARL